MSITIFVRIDSDTFDGAWGLGASFQEMRIIVTVMTISFFGNSFEDADPLLIVQTNKIY